MRRAVVVAAALGFAVTFVATCIVGIWHYESSECDGVCVEKFPFIGALAFFAGVLGAMVGGFGAKRILDRDSADLP